MRIVKNEEIATQSAIKQSEKPSLKRSIVISDDEDDWAMPKPKNPMMQKKKSYDNMVTATLQSQCEQVLRLAVKDRSDQVFNDIRAFRSPEELSEGLEMCESLFMELKYVKNDISKCFPDDFPVFEIYRECYTKAIHARLKPDMTDLV
jgi:hypothetical protein